MRISDENIAIVPKEAVSVPRATVFGPSHAMRKVLEQVMRAAATHEHILICGEPGTGREMVAREIHRLSPQMSSGRFVKVSRSVCAAAAAESISGVRGRSSRAK